MAVRDECPLQNGVMTLRGPHPERVPGLHNPISGGVSRHNHVHNLRVVRIAGVEAIGIEPVPNRRESAEMAVSIEPVTALHSFGA